MPLEGGDSSGQSPHLVLPMPPALMIYLQAQTSSMRAGATQAGITEARPCRLLWTELCPPPQIPNPWVLHAAWPGNPSSPRAAGPRLVFNISLTRKSLQTWPDPLPWAARATDGRLQSPSFGLDNTFLLRSSQHMKRIVSKYKLQAGGQPCQASGLVRARLLVVELKGI